MSVLVPVDDLDKQDCLMGHGLNFSLPVSIKPALAVKNPPRRWIVGPRLTA